MYISIEVVFGLINKYNQIMTIIISLLDNINKCDGILLPTYDKIVYLRTFVLIFVQFLFVVRYEFN